MKTMSGSVVVVAIIGILLGLPAQTLAQPKGPVKIGAALPLTGAFAINGQEALDGFRLYMEEVGWEAGGRNIELIIEDHAGKADVGLTKVRKLVEHDEVQILTGFTATAVGLAVNDYIREKKIPTVISADTGLAALTMPGKFLSPYLFRFSLNAGQGPPQAAEWAYKEANWKKVVTITSDYVGGLEIMSIFGRAFCTVGGQVIQEIYPPLGTNDFAPYLANVDRSADAVVVFTPGADGLRLGRQYQEYGVKLPVLDLHGQITFEPNLPQLGRQALGIYSVANYSPVIDTPENKRFVAAFRAKHKRLPFSVATDGYAGAKAIVAALKAVNGNVEDKGKFMAALKGVDFDSPKGRVRLDGFQHVIQTEYIRKVESVGGELVNVPIRSYPDASQFWIWKPDEYVKYPTDTKGKLTDCAKVLAR